MRTIVLVTMLVAIVTIRLLFIIAILVVLPMGMTVPVMTVMMPILIIIGVARLTAK